MKPKEYLGSLETALDAYRFDDVERLTERIDPSRFKPKQAEKALAMLRRKRLFADLENAACMFQFSGVDSPKLRRLWAQALLDQNRVSQALLGLRGMRKRVAKDPVEKSEVRGLIGRAHKQLYVNEGDEEHLVAAIRAYRSGWKARQGDYRWHGINLAALLARAERDGVAPPVAAKSDEVARAVLDEVEALGDKAERWDYGTAMEASLALDRDPTETARWVKLYVEHPGVDAFELGSTLRQMKEVWQLEDTALGRKILPVLEGELARREGAELELSPASDPDKTVYEVIYGPEAGVQLEWFETMTRRCHAVGRVFSTDTGTRYGTGFLAAGAALNPQWGEEPVLVTNSHVVSPAEQDQAPLEPGEASIEFTRVPGQPNVKLGELLFSSLKTDLDCSILRVVPPDGTEVLAPSYKRPPKEGGEEPRIYVIGHPRVGELKVSLYDNRLIEYADPYVLYRSPTEPGSSGSPVFTRAWKLFALHHGARGAKLANEGILLGPIRDRASA